jgi:50S ribosomal protein L16 3-hydroxylase
MIQGVRQFGMLARPSRGRSLQLLAGMTPRQFMHRHWQRRPLLVRSAVAKMIAPISRTELFALAARDDVESRLVRVRNRRGWSLTEGPIARSKLPSLRERGWTLLVQGVDLHHDAAHFLLQQFRFLPDARLDDLMISWASDGGGVGPHVDSYDVFLLQARGKRRWRIARSYDPALDERAPIKVLRRFSAEQEFVLDPGDLLYLPPGWAHEGVAVGGDCMTCSIGLFAPRRGALAAELVQRLAETYDDSALYRDAGQSATGSPAAIPATLGRFAADAVQGLVSRRSAVGRALGEILSEPKPHVWFTKSEGFRRRPGAVALDRRTRMLYDARHVFINGEAVPARGRDALVLRRLADERTLNASAVRRASAVARTLLAEWLAAGWLHDEAGPPAPAGKPRKRRRRIRRATA